MTCLRGEYASTHCDVQWLVNASIAQQDSYSTDSKQAKAFNNRAKGVKKSYGQHGVHEYSALVELWIS